MADPRDRTQHSDLASREASDPDEVRARYDAWLGDDADVVGFTAPETTGYSSLTYLADVERGGQVTREVLRSRPSGATVFRDYDLAMQVACMRNLGDVVPTPNVLAFEEDPSILGEPFYVMEYVEGRIPGDNPPYTAVGWLHDAAPEVQRAHYLRGMDVLGRLAGVTPAAADLEAHLVRPSLGPTGMDQQLQTWRELLEWGREGTDQPTLDAAWEWLEANRPADPGRDVVVWGDARISNMVFDPEGTPIAVLDWEMAGTGPGEVDLAWYLWMDRQFTVVFDAPRLPGFPGEEELVDRWQQGSGQTPRDLDWYLAFAGIRFATTIMRIGIRSIADGAMPADADVYRNHLGTRLLARHLDLEPPGEIGMMG